MDNDGLIIASGGRFLKKLPGIEHAITPCEGVEAAVQIRDRLVGMKGGTIAFGFAGNPKEPAAMRGGPIFEFMPGMTGNAWFDNTDLPRSDGGLLQANAFCQVTGRDKVYVAGDSGSFPGPDWLPKQAHMADLQAEAAVANLLGEFQGKAPSHTFRAELICIVDTRTSGILVKRTETRNVILPSSPVFH